MDHKARVLQNMSEGKEMMSWVNMLAQYYETLPDIARLAVGLGTVVLLGLVARMIVMFCCRYFKCNRCEG